MPADGAVGEDFQQRSELTPARVKGATTVSVGEAACLMEKLGERLVVVQAMGQSNAELPRAQRMPRAGASNADEATQQAFTSELGALTGNDRARPVLFYCHHEYCHLSYNATLRAVKAGYRHVYWLRQGNQGWSKAGMPLRGETVDAQGVSPRVLLALAKCDEKGLEATQMFFRQVMLQTGGFPGRDQIGLSRAIAVHQSCLKPLAAAWAPNPPAAALAERALAEVETLVKQRFDALYKEVEDDPLSFYRPLMEIRLEELKEVLERAQEYSRTPAQACGRLQKLMPADQTEIDRLKRHISQYRECLNSNMPPTVGEIFDDAEEEKEAVAFFRAVSWAYAGMQRYTCAIHSVPGCIPDAAWREVRAVANPHNAKLVVDEFTTRAKRRDAFRDASREVDEWVATVNRDIARRNREIQQQNNSPPPVYQAPRYELPPARRQPSHSSRSGVL